MELPITPYGLLTDEQKQYILDNMEHADRYTASGWARVDVDTCFSYADTSRVASPFGAPSTMLTSSARTLLYIIAL